MKNIQILLVATFFIQSSISQCAHFDPSATQVVDMGKIKRKREGGKPLTEMRRNRGRVAKTPKYDNPFNLAHALVIVPGLNGSIGGPAHNFSRWLQKKHTMHHWIGTPQESRADFGQRNCMQHVHKEKTASEKNILESETPYILFGTSQGTGTSINLFNGTSENHNIMLQNPEALILQSVMLSGNSAIYHTVTNMGLPLVADLPFSYYWLPYLATIFFKSYAPAGEQPIFNVEKMPTDLPIIILHCENDQQLSFKDAQGLYAALCRNGNDNVYLFEMPNSDGDVNHFVTFDNKTKRDILTILKNHQIVQEDVNAWDSLEDEIKLRQPEVKKEWLDHFDSLLKKEKRMPYMPYFNKFLKLTMIGLAAYLIYAHDIVNKTVDKINTMRTHFD
jgi:hypothetical protein